MLRYDQVLAQAIADIVYFRKRLFDFGKFGLAYFCSDDGGGEGVAGHVDNRGDLWSCMQSVEGPLESEQGRRREKSAGEAGDRYLFLAFGRWREVTLSFGLSRVQSRRLLASVSTHWDLIVVSDSGSGSTPTYDRERDRQVCCIHGVDPAACGMKRRTVEKRAVITCSGILRFVLRQVH